MIWVGPKTQIARFQVGGASCGRSVLAILIGISEASSLPLELSPGFAGASCLPSRPYRSERLEVRVRVWCQDRVQNRSAGPGLTTAYKRRPEERIEYHPNTRR